MVRRVPLHLSHAFAAGETIGSGRCDRRRRGPTVRLALIVIGLLAMTGGARAQDLPAPPLIVGSEENYPPFATGDSDATAGGFTVELWRAVAAEQRLTYTIRVRPFAQLLAEFKAGQIDVLINLARSDERRTFASFSVPHVIVRGAIFVRKGDSRIASEADLRGASIIVIRADLADDYAESNGWGPQLVRVDDAADGLRLLASGEHDAMLLGKLAGLQTLQQLRLGNVRALGPPAGFAQTFSFAVHKDHPELLATINEGLAVVKSTGVYDGLYERWFGVFEPRQLPPRHLLKYLGALAMLMLIVVIAFAVRDHERKKGAGQLRASEERLRLALSAARQGLYDLDVESGQCIVSPEYALMLGYDPENFQETRTAWLARMHPDDRDAAEAVYTAYLADQRDDYRVEFRQRTKDGGWIWVLSLGSLTARTADGRPRRLLGTHTDITTRKLAERALEQSEERFRTLTESAPILIYLTDERGDYIYVNPRWCAATGMTPVQAAGQGWMNGVHDDDRATIAERWQTAARSGGTWGFEYRLKSRAGQVSWVYGTAAPIRDASGAIVGYVGTNSDITERRQAALERDQLARKMQETQKLESLGVLAGGIAHDFNNLLTSILGHASIAATELPSDSPAQECLGQIDEASRRAADLCNQMLAYSGRGQFLVRKVDLGQLVEKTAQMLQSSLGKTATLEFHLEPGLPPVEVDPTQIQQVIMNLVLNASEAIGEASGVIRLTTGRSGVIAGDGSGQRPGPADTEKSQVVLEVTDTGGGMSEETRARIFDPFFTTKFTGRGLGLAAVLGIVRGHHGTITVRSQLGRGTTFRLMFPAAVGPVEALSAQAPRTEDWRGEGTVLVVDDEPTMRNAVSRMLRLLGFEAMLAVDGRDAIAIFQAHPERYVLVLLDLTMPHVDGMQTLEELRRLRPAVPVVLMSGFNAQEVRLRFSSVSVPAFLQKPFNLGALRTTMKDVLDQPRPHD